MKRKGKLLLMTAVAILNLGANALAAETPAEAKKRSRLINNTGMNHYKAKEYEKAIEKFKEAAELDSQYVLTRLNLAASLAKLNRNDEAIASLEEAHRLMPVQTLKKLHYDDDFKDLRSLHLKDKPLGKAYRDFLMSQESATVYQDRINGVEFKFPARLAKGPSGFESKGILRAKVITLISLHDPFYAGEEFNGPELGHGYPFSFALKKYSAKDYRREEFKDENSANMNAYLEGQESAIPVGSGAGRRLQYSFDSVEGASHKVSQVELTDRVSVFILDFRYGLSGCGNDSEESQALCIEQNEKQSEASNAAMDMITKSFKITRLE